MNKLYEEIMNNNENIMNVLDYIYKANVIKYEDIEELYYNEKHKNDTILKTYDRWNKEGYVIKKGEKSVKLYKNSDIKTSYFDVSQVEKIDNTKNEPVGNTYFIDDRQFILKTYLNEDLFNENKYTGLKYALTMYVIHNKFDYSSKKEWIKNSVIPYLKESLNEIKIENEADFKEIIEDVARKSHKMMGKIWNEAIKENMGSKRPLDNSQTLYYTINENKSQVNGRKEENNYVENEPRREAKTIVSSSRENVNSNAEPIRADGSSKKRDMEDGRSENFDRGNRHIHSESEQVLSNDTNNTENEMADNDIQRRNVSRTMEDSTNGYRPVGKRDELQQKARTSSRSDKSQLYGNSLFNYIEEKQKEATINNQGGERRSDEIDRGQSSTDQQVEASVSVSRELQSEDNGRIHQENRGHNKSGNANERVSNEHREEKDKATRDITQGERELDNGYSNDEDLNNKKVEDKTSTFFIDKKEYLDNDFINENENNDNTFNKSQKFEDNVNAIKTLKLIEKENRLATKEEQEILSKYVGWGGLANYCFDKDRSSPENYNLIKNLLDENEYRDAVDSVNSAYFTPDYVVKEIYNKIEDFGFKGGKILEPSCGIGKFFMNMPKELRENSQITGIEKDNISARICAKLYPSMEIKNKGYEEEKIKNNTYNLVIGNIPFGDIKVYDTEYNKDKLLIHDYFINKSLDKLADGGICAIISSTGTMDKKDYKARALFAEKANFLGAIRLPSGTFGDTKASTDILFFQKDLKNVKGIEQEFVNTDTYFNTESDKITNSNNTYYNSMTKEYYEITNYQYISNVMSKELFKEYFIGLPKDDYGDVFEESDYNHKMVNVDLKKLSELNDKYNDWKTGKISEKPVFDKEKDFYVFGSYIDITENENIKNIPKYYINVGEENPKYYKEKTLKSGQVKFEVAKGEEHYIYGNKEKIVINAPVPTDQYAKDMYKKISEISINKYFKNDINKVIGTLRTDTGQFGRFLINSSLSDSNLIREELKNKLEDIKCEYREPQNTIIDTNDDTIEYLSKKDYEDNSINKIRKYSYFVLNDKICYKENDTAYYVKNLNGSKENQLKSLIKIKNMVYEILSYEEKNQVEEANKIRNNLLETYNNFYEKYGLRINSKDIKALISEDDDKGLLLSLEIGNDEVVENFKIIKNKLKKDWEDVEIVETKILNDGTELKVVENEDGELKYYDNNKNEYSVKQNTEFIMKEGKEGYAQIFYEPVITNVKEIEKVDNANDGMILSLQKLGYIDIDYIKNKTGLEKDKILSDLKGQIYKVAENEYITRDEFLSGNIYHKIDSREEIINNYEIEKNKLLEELEKAEKDNNEELIKDYGLKINDCNIIINQNKTEIEELKQVLPKRIPFNNIDIGVGATWLPAKYYNKFLNDVFKVSTTGYNCANVILNDKIRPSKFMVSKDKYIRIDETIKIKYGTEEKDCLSIFENALNLEPITIYDYIEEDGKTKAVVNSKKTQLANNKVEEIKNAFREWKENSLTEEQQKEIEELYNRKFNSLVGRKFNGDILDFPCMNKNIVLNEHQKNGVARMVFGRNTGLAHCVGAGKTFEICAGIMKFKQLGIANKSMVVVPKPIIEQWQREFLNLYPTARLLVPTEKDFSKENRKKFLNKIATGNYDAIILSQEQFAKIPLSKERQCQYITAEKQEYEKYLQELKLNSNSNNSSMNNTIKTIRKQVEALELQLKELQNEERKDNLIEFEKLGIDKLFVDEAHYYKNSFFATKLNRIAGIQSKKTQRTFDLQMKTRYLNEKTDYKGVYLATGTPITNSIVELYTMMKYLQPDILEQTGLNNLDDFVANFCEIKSDFELDNTGSDYRQKTRINTFKNCPELVKLFKESWDIVNVKDLKNIKLPEVNRHNIELPATQLQNNIMKTLIERNKAMQGGGFDPKKDNMLKLTNDGKMAALDPRLYDNKLDDEEGTKVNALIKNIVRTYYDTLEEKGTQMIFSDMGVPKPEKTFDIYNDIKSKLIKEGIKEDEIAFIGDYNTPELKDQMQKKMKAGEIRVLISSTDKGGTGLNVQNKLKAVHHLSLPWKPSDIDQREGRIIRQGNMYDQVDIYTYVSQGTFDARTFEILGNKQKFIKQIMEGDETIRRYDDIGKDENTISYDDLVQLSLPNSNIKKMKQLERDIKILEAEQNQFNSRIRENKNRIDELPNEINIATEIKDKIIVDVNRLKNEDFNKYTIKIYGKEIGNEATYNERKEGTKALYDRMFTDKTLQYKAGTETKVANYRGFDIYVNYDMVAKNFVMRMQSSETGFKYNMVDLADSDTGNMTRIDNFIKSINEERKEQHEAKISNMENELKSLKESVNQTYDKKKVLDEKKEELKQLQLEEEAKKEEFTKQEEQTNNEDQKVLK